MPLRRVSFGAVSPRQNLNLSPGIELRYDASLAKSWVLVKFKVGIVLIGRQDTQHDIMSAIMLSVVRLSAIELSVVAPLIARAS
jgi:hypothetical protein